VESQLITIETVIPGEMYFYTKKQKLVLEIDLATGELTAVPRKTHWPWEVFLALADLFCGGVSTACFST
jgi:hypothetical protein